MHIDTVQGHVMSGLVLVRLVVLCKRQCIHLLGGDCGENIGLVAMRHGHVCRGFGAERPGPSARHLVAHRVVSPYTHVTLWKQ